MRNQQATIFNKEKLIFLGVTVLLAICVYKAFASRPVRLELSTPVTPLPVPAPLAPEVPDTRQGDVTYYLQSGMYSGLAVNRERNDPFAPIYIQSELVPTSTAIGPIPKISPKIEPVPIAPPEPTVVEKEKQDPNKFDGTDRHAKVDFSAVISMNGTVYGLLKDKDGKTIQVKVGDYLDDFKYTVTKIDKQAIWVTDENDHMFVARDQSYAVNGAAGGDADDEKPKAKEKPAKDKPAKADKSDAKPAAKPSADSTAAALAEAAKQLANLQKSMNNNNNVINNDNGGRKRRGNY